MGNDRHAILPGMIMPSAEPGATRLAIAYDIVRRFGRPEGDALAVAREVGDVVRAMLAAESGPSKP